MTGMATVAPSVDGVGATGSCSSPCTTSSTGATFSLPAGSSSPWLKSGTERVSRTVTVSGAGEGSSARRAERGVGSLTEEGPETTGSVAMRPVV